MIEKYKPKLLYEKYSIYQGQTNNSYQREGFGIHLQNTYETYIGYFKANKAHGLGMVLFPAGDILYGYFYNNQM